MSGNIARRRDHGDGGIDERGPDRWRLRWRVDGKRYAKSFHGSIGEARGVRLLRADRLPLRHEG